MTVIDIIYHDGASAAPDQAGQSGGFAQARSTAIRGWTA